MPTIAITGAGRGIGLELVRQYAASGADVIALVRNPETALSLQQISAGVDGRVKIAQMDVAVDRSVLAAAKAGNGPIDVLLNVAGVVGVVNHSFETHAWDEWYDAFNVMVIGPLRVMQAFLPRMGSGAKVINISSQLAASTWPYGGFYSYGAAKAGLNRMMRSVAIDVKDRGIIVGLLHPGWVKTDMGGPDAEITPEESARGIRAVTQSWTLERSGDFLKWNGETHPW